jgi:hypothetical protein
MEAVPLQIVETVDLSAGSAHSTLVIGATQIGTFEPTEAFVDWRFWAPAIVLVRSPLVGPKEPFWD